MIQVTSQTMPGLSPGLSFAPMDPDKALKEFGDFAVGIEFAG
jgi:hypothetical protein